MASFIEAFILLLGIIDPPASFGAFISFTKKKWMKRKNEKSH